MVLAPGNWNTAAYPNSSSVNAVIGGPAPTSLVAVVDPNTGFTVGRVAVNNLTVQSDGALNIYAPAVQGTGPAGITLYGTSLQNAGPINITGGQGDNLVFANSGTTAITGAGTIAMTSGDLEGQNNATISQGAGHTISGDGTIGVGIVSNAGLVSGNTGGTLVINNQG